MRALKVSELKKISGNGGGNSGSGGCGCGRGGDRDDRPSKKS